MDEGNLYNGVHLHPIERIFLIDDDQIINFINEKQVEFFHVCKHIDTYLSAGNALSELKKITLLHPEELPALIFIDVNMPGMDGWEFLEQFQQFPKEAKEKCKVFMLSASMDAEDIEKSKHYSVVSDYLPKPLKRDVLLRLLAA